MTKICVILYNLLFASEIESENNFIAEFYLIKNKLQSN